MKSERELMRLLPERLDYLWFLGYGLEDEISDYSVLSKARARWGQPIFESLFVRPAQQCLLCVLLTETWKKAFLLWWLTLVIAMGYQSLSKRATRYFYTNHFGKLKDSFTWETYIRDGKLVSMNRDVELAFPVDGTAVATESEGFICVEFNDRGRARIPLSAFETPEQLEEFKNLFASGPSKAI